MRASSPPMGIEYGGIAPGMRRAELASMSPLFLSVAASAVSMPMRDCRASLAATALLTSGLVGSSAVGPEAAARISSAVIDAGL